MLTQGHFFIAFREKGRERRMEREKHRLVASHMHLDQGLKLQTLSYGMTLRTTEPYCLGLIAYKRGI